jgi:hypothetical protein
MITYFHPANQSQWLQEVPPGLRSWLLDSLAGTDGFSTVSL